MSKIFAICKTLEAGSKCDEKKMTDSGINIGDKIELENARVGLFHTDICLVGYKGLFNSVFFDFVDENDKEYDIYQDRKFQTYRLTES